MPILRRLTPPPSPPPLEGVSSRVEPRQPTCNPASSSCSRNPPTRLHDVATVGADRQEHISVRRPHPHNVEGIPRGSARGRRSVVVVVVPFDFPLGGCLRCSPSFPVKESHERSADSRVDHDNDLCYRVVGLALASLGMLPHAASLEW